MTPILIYIRRRSFSALRKDTKVTSFLFWRSNMRKKLKQTNTLIPRGGSNLQPMEHQTRDLPLLTQLARFGLRMVRGLAISLQDFKVFFFNMNIFFNHYWQIWTVKPLYKLLKAVKHAEEVDQLTRFGLRMVRGLAISLQDSKVTSFLFWRSNMRKKLL